MVSLIMESVTSSVQDSLLSIAESVALWVEFPVVISVLLLTRGKVSVSFSVHISDNFFLRLANAERVDHFFSAFKVL